MPKLTKRQQQRAEEALRFADSYARANCIIKVFLAGHPRAVEMLGAAGHWARAA